MPLTRLLPAATEPAQIPLGTDSPALFILYRVTVERAFHRMWAYAGLRACGGLVHGGNPAVNLLAFWEYLQAGKEIVPIRSARLRSGGSAAPRSRVEYVVS